MKKVTLENTGVGFCARDEEDNLYHICHTDEIPSLLDFLYEEFPDMINFWLEHKKDD